MKPSTRQLFTGEMLREIIDNDSESSSSTSSSTSSTSHILDISDSRPVMNALGYPIEVALHGCPIYIEQEQESGSIHTLATSTVSRPTNSPLEKESLCSVSHFVFDGTASSSSANDISLVRLREREAGSIHALATSTVNRPESSPDKTESRRSFSPIVFDETASPSSANDKSLVREQEAGFTHALATSTVNQPESSPELTESRRSFSPNVFEFDETASSSSAKDIPLDSQSPSDITLKLLYEQNLQLQKELRDLKSTLTTSERSKQRKRPVVVPPECSQAVRSTYDKLFRDDKGTGFNLSLTKTCVENTAVISLIIIEVQSLYGRDKWGVDQIKKACKTYFNSLRDKMRRKEKGTYQQHTDAARKRSRKFRKLQRRNAAIATLNLSESFSESEVREVLHIDYMSSEESMSEGEGNGTIQKTRRLRKLPWERSRLTSLKHKLDCHFAETAPTLVTRVLPQFVFGRPSTRPAPQGAPSWAVRS